MSVSPLIYLVDDDPSVIKALGRLLNAAGWETEAFASAESFLSHLATDLAHPAALVLDIELPGLDGLALQRSLAAHSDDLAIVFLTGRGDIPMSVSAMKAGAVDFLTKPVSSEVLIAAVREALAKAADRAERRMADVGEFERRLARLTERERQVLAAVAAGRLNKQIAGDLGIVEQTVKFHRARLMQRMEAHTAAELMHIAARLGIGAATPPGAAAGAH